MGLEGACRPNISAGARPRSIFLRSQLTKLTVSVPSPGKTQLIGRGDANRVKSWCCSCPPHSPPHKTHKPSTDRWAEHVVHTDRQSHKAAKSQGEEALSIMDRDKPIALMQVTGPGAASALSHASQGLLECSLASIYFQQKWGTLSDCSPSSQTPHPLFSWSP